MDGRDKLMKKIQMCDFYLVDLSLYLDSHPDCTEALEMYHKYMDMCKTYTEEYNMHYGPITKCGVMSDDKWTWATESWPWERGE